MSKLNKSRVLEMIQSYGSNPKRWPQAERQAGRVWLDDNPVLAEKYLADAHMLDQALNTVHAPTSDAALLQARILKAAINTAQDNSVHALAANDIATNIFSALKTAVAVLVLTTGMGFGIGQAAASDRAYASAEALLSVSMQSEYIEADLYGDGS